MRGSTAGLTKSSLDWASPSLGDVHRPLTRAGPAPMLESEATHDLFPRLPHVFTPASPHSS